MHEPSVRALQVRISSRDFAEWIAEYNLRAEESDPDRPPTADELGAKLSAWAAAHKK